MSAEGSAAEAPAPLATCRFAFDEAAFREYYELRFRPHDRPSGWKFMWLGLVALAIGVFLGILVWPGVLHVVEALRSGAEVDVPTVVLLLYLSAWCAAYSWVTVYGFRLWRGLRHPRWGAPRWEARTELSFRALADGPTWRPVSERSYRSLLAGPFVLATLAWADAEWHDEPYAFDSVPGLLPRFSEDELRPSSPAPREARFEARFYRGSLSKGSGGGAAAFAYSEVFDIVEDRRFPDLAVIRMKDERSEVVVRPSAFEGASWEEVKALVKEANGWTTLREALFGKGKGRRKGKGGRAMSEIRMGWLPMGGVVRLEGAEAPVMVAGRMQRERGDAGE
ncbi:hypothetical protein [Gordonibacter sp. An230]|uniref:hypothetical protein n=1 Tax=Gordonibacter sp. An230 TaxID=1965592 RepID=UPI000B38255A|nr:hypothetical protein [Gordonibacter sp. An230]